jgi:hypothetical protein
MDFEPKETKGIHTIPLPISHGSDAPKKGFFNPCI